MFTRRLRQLLAVLAACLLPLAAFADGKSFYETKKDTSSYETALQNHQRAVISFGDGVEKMLIAVNYRDEVGARGLWIFPVPGTPDKVRIDLTDVFPSFGGVDERPRADGIIDKSMLWMRASQLYPWPVDFVLTRKPGKKAEGGPQGVEVHQVVEKYGLRAEAITAPSLDALADHLRTGELNVPRDQLEAFRPYLTEKHVLIVVRIASREEVERTFESKERSPGLLVEFPTEYGYYPMVPTASYGRAWIPVTLYVIGHVVADADAVLERVYTSWYRDYSADASLSPLLGVEPSSVVDYTLIQMDAPASSFTSDFTFYPAYIFGFDLADALIGLTDSGGIYVIWALLFLALSYAAAGLAGLILLRRWHRVAPVGLMNVLTLFGVTVGGYFWLPRRTAHAFWPLFTVIFVALTLIVQGLLSLCLWWF
jgi:hypothetical protein